MANFIRLRERILNNPLLVTESYARVLMGALSERFNIESLEIDGEDYDIEELREEANAYNGGNPMARKPYEVVNGKAIIPVKGSLVHKTGYLRPYSGMTGYDGIKANIDIALADDSVSEIVFDMNSAGGEVSGCFELSDYIYNQRGKKPMTALVDDMACSACYAIASAADTIVAGELSTTGSIGVITGHISHEKKLSDDGVKVTLITAGKHKADGNPYQDLPEDVRASIQARVDKIYTTFVEKVSRNRGISVESVRATEARTFFGYDAAEEKLVDKVESAISYLENLSSDGGSNNNVMMESSEMNEESNLTSQELESAVAAAVTGERDRIKAILTSDNAVGRETMADHLAFNTQMSVEDADAMLAVAPKQEQQEQPVVQEQANGFQEALQSSSVEPAGVESEAAETDEIGSMLALVGSKDLAKFGE